MIFFRWFQRVNLQDRGSIPVLNLSKAIRNNPLRGYENVQRLPLQGTNNIPPWEKENHLQMCLGMGYVNSQEAISKNYLVFEQRSDLELMGIFFNFFIIREPIWSWVSPKPWNKVNSYGGYLLVAIMKPLDLQQGMGIPQISVFSVFFWPWLQFVTSTAQNTQCTCGFLGSCGSVNLFQHVTGLSNIDANRYWMILSNSCLVTFTSSKTYTDTKPAQL